MNQITTQVLNQADIDLKLRLQTIITTTIHSTQHPAHNTTHTAQNLYNIAHLPSYQPTYLSLLPTE